MTLLKMVMVFCSLCSILVATIGEAAADVSDASEIGSPIASPIVSFGDLRGHLEPCGCDPRTDVGGLRRIAAAVIRYRLTVPEVLVLHTGNLLMNKKILSDDDRGMIDAVAIIAPQASLVNALEWQRLILTKSPLPGGPWVLSNFVNHHEGPFSSISPMITVKGTEIFGYLGPSKSLNDGRNKQTKTTSLHPIDSAMFRIFRKLSKSKKPKGRILLFSGSDRDLKKIAGSGFFGIIISSNTVPIGGEAGDLEQQNESTLHRIVSKEAVIWSVPFGGTGLLRSGGLESSPQPLPLAQALQSSGMSSASSVIGGLPQNNTREVIPLARPIHWLRVEEENGTPPGVLKIFDDLRALGKQAFLQRAELKKLQIQSTEYVGSDACQACHKASFGIWSHSKHGVALATLKAQNRHEDPSCVECHVVGFNDKGGYVNEVLSPQLANVQCESCHGPRKAHVSNPTIHGNVAAKEACAQCHTLPHSPRFSFDAYWEKIKHK